MKKHRETLYNFKIQESKIENEMNALMNKISELTKEKHAVVREKNSLISEIQKVSVSKGRSDFAEVEFKNPDIIEIEIKEAERKIESLNDKIRQRMANYNEKKQDYDLVKTRFQKMNYLSDSSASKERISKAGDNLEEMIKHDEVKVAEIMEENNRSEHQSAKLDKDLEEVVKTRKEVSKELKSLMLSYKSRREAKDQVVKQLTEHKVSHVDDKREYILMKKKLEELKKDAEVNIKSINLSSYLKLLDEVNKRQIPKVYGLLIDLLDIDEVFHIACNTLLLPKLFTIVVEDFATGQILIDLNQSLKGGKINIYPLEWIDNDISELDYPNTDEVAILKDSISPQDHHMDNKKLINLTKDVLGNSIIVSDIKKAHMYAEDYKLNCVTAKGEIVYSGGFLSKLGFYDNNIDMIQSYKDFRSCHKQFQVVEAKIENYNNVLQKLNDEELKRVKDCEDIELEKEKKTNKIKLLLNEENTIRSAKLQIQKLLFRNRKEADELKAAIESCKSQIEILNNSQGKFSKKKLSSLQNETDDRDVELMQIFNVMAELEKEKVEQQNILERLIEQRLSSMSYQTDKMLNTAVRNIMRNEETQKDKLKQKLESKIDSLQTRLGELNMQTASLSRECDRKTIELEDAKKTLAEIRKEILAVNQRRLDIQRVVDKYQFKIDSIDVDEDDLKRLERKSQKRLLEELNKILKDTKRKYTEKDRLNFEKLDDHFSHMSKVEKEIEFVKESKSSFRSFISIADANMYALNELSFEKFQKNFKEIFEEIVPEGRAHVRIREVPIGTQTNSELAKSIDLKASFSTQGLEGENLSLENLSPGQKTVIAICILFSFQKLYPASFYCLDEITADLDAVYVEKIVKM